VATVVADVCVWSGGGDGKASDGANWVGGTKPQEGDDILFDGTSTAACEWNLELELGSWTQTVDYSGKVTVPKSDGMLFKVTGDIAVHGGELVFAGNTTAVGSGTETVKHGIGYTLEAANIVIGTKTAYSRNQMLYSIESLFP